MDAKELFIRKFVASIPTFGPGSRTKGCIAHIQKELVEVEAALDNQKCFEWVDVFLLAMDGLLRSVKYDGTLKHVVFNADIVAEKALELVMRKIRRNELREWPDYRTQDKDGAIEHVAARNPGGQIFGYTGPTPADPDYAKVMAVFDETKDVIRFSVRDYDGKYVDILVPRSQAKVLADALKGIES